MLDDKSYEQLAEMKNARQVGFLTLFPSLVYKYQMKPQLLEEMQENFSGEFEGIGRSEPHGITQEHARMFS